MEIRQFILPDIGCILAGILLYLMYRQPVLSGMETAGSMTALALAPPRNPPSKGRVFCTNERRRWGMMYREGTNLMDLALGDLEQELIDSYLRTQGVTRRSLNLLPRDRARCLRIAASTFASTRLAEIELRACFVRSLQGDVRYK
jgi:hypothetical protein